MKSKLFESLNDRQNIINAYQQIYESSDTTINTTTINTTTINDTNNKKSTIPVQSVTSFLKKTYPNISDEAIEKIDEEVYKMVEAADVDNPFIYFIPDVEVPIHVENDGIGRYEFWGHEEFDKGHDYASVDIDEDDIIRDNVPDGSFLVFNDDYNRLADIAQEEFKGNFDYEDEDGRGTYNSFTTMVKYELVVEDDVKFKNFIDNLAVDKNIKLDGSDKVGKVDDVNNNDVNDNDVNNKI